MTEKNNISTESIVQLYWDIKGQHHYLLIMGLYETADILEATLTSRMYTFIFSEL